MFISSKQPSHSRRNSGSSCTTSNARVDQNVYEKFMGIEDYSTLPKKHVSKKFNGIEAYDKLSKKHGVSISTVKNYYHILSKQPNVMIKNVQKNNYDTEKEKNPDEEISCTSPVLDYKKNKRKRIKTNDPSLLSKKKKTESADETKQATTHSENHSKSSKNASLITCKTSRNNQFLPSKSKISYSELKVDRNNPPSVFCQEKNYSKYSSEPYSPEVRAEVITCYSGTSSKKETLKLSKNFPNNLMFIKQHTNTDNNKSSLSQKNIKSYSNTKVKKSEKGLKNNSQKNSSISEKDSLEDIVDAIYELAGTEKNKKTDHTKANDNKLKMQQSQLKNSGSFKKNNSGEELFNPKSKKSFSDKSSVSSKHSIKCNINNSENFESILKSPQKKMSRKVLTTDETPCKKETEKTKKDLFSQRDPRLRKKMEKSDADSILVDRTAVTENELEKSQGVLDKDVSNTIKEIIQENQNDSSDEDDILNLNYESDLDDLDGESTCSPRQSKRDKFSNERKEKKKFQENQKKTSTQTRLSSNKPVITQIQNNFDISSLSNGVNSYPMNNQTNPNFIRPNIPLNLQNIIQPCRYSAIQNNLRANISFLPKTSVFHQIASNNAQYTMRYQSVVDSPNENDLNKAKQRQYTNIDTFKNNDYFFKQVCFSNLRTGRCFNTLCKFEHRVMNLARELGKKDMNSLFSILDNIVKNRFEDFLKTAWKELNSRNDVYSIFEKVYDAEKTYNTDMVKLILDDFIQHQIEKHDVKKVVGELSLVVDKRDKVIVTEICKKIKHKIELGHCWETIKGLCEQVTPPLDMIEIILLECQKDKKNIKEILNLINKLSQVEKLKIEESLLTNFYELVENNNFGSNNSNRRILLRNVVEIDLTNNDNLKARNPKSFNQTESDDLALNIVMKSPDKGELRNFQDYKLKALNEPLKVDLNWTRLRFAEFCLQRDKIHQELLFLNYDSAWKLIDNFCQTQKKEKELLTRVFYQLLNNTLNENPNHLSEIIKRAVQSTSSELAIQVLFDVGICILIDLTNNELWIMALQLLKLLKIFQKKEPKFSFVILSVEIYLANNNPLKALHIFQESRLLNANREDWLVTDCKEGDELLRNKVLNALLQSLTYSYPEKTICLFEFIAKDQYSPYHPIDLSLFLDKLALLLLLNNADDLIKTLCLFVMDNDMTFGKQTYQEILCRLLYIDDLLANQIFQYAINIGIYNDIKISSFIHVVINVNWLEEEIYLVLQKLIRELAMNIGSGIEKLKPNQLKVIFLFEDVPCDKKIDTNENAGIFLDKIKKSRSVLIDLLSSKFEPPIRCQTRYAVNKVCKIISRSLVNYLKAWK